MAYPKFSLNACLTFAKHLDSSNPLAYARGMAAASKYYSTDPAHWPTPCPNPYKWGNPSWHAWTQGYRRYKEMFLPPDLQTTASFNFEAFKVKKQVNMRCLNPRD